MKKKMEFERNKSNETVINCKCACGRVMDRVLPSVVYNNGALCDNCRRSYVTYPFDFDFVFVFVSYSASVLKQFCMCVFFCD